jgi:hypothetical protein
VIAEEKAYQKNVQGLKDKGDMAGDEGHNTGAEYSNQYFSN